MTSVETTTSPQAPGLNASASRGASAESPRQRLQKLLAVPGHEPSRANDLLLLRPDAGDRGYGHVVFFHGDIQVSEGERMDTGQAAAGGDRRRRTGFSDWLIKLVYRHPQ